MSDTSTINRTPLMIVLISGAFVAILNQTLLGTALPHIMDDLNIETATAQWLQSIFMLVNGIMIPITAFLIERFTTRALFLTAMGSFALGTAVCAISPDFTVLLIGRILQAAGAGIMMPLMQTIMFLVFPIEKRGSAMGVIWSRHRVCAGDWSYIIRMVSRAFPLEKFILYCATDCDFGYYRSVQNTR